MHYSALRRKHLLMYWSDDEVGVLMLLNFYFFWQVDSTMLQYQNNKLAQQLEVQRNEISVLESKLSQLRSKQVTFDDNLSTINRVWNQVFGSFIIHLLCEFAVS